MFDPTENPTLNNFTYTLINGGLNNQSDTVDDDVEANCTMLLWVYVFFC